MPTTAHIAYRNDILHIEELPLPDIAAQVETPAYCYAATAIRSHYQVLTDALDGLDAHIRYAVKANGNLAVLRLMANLGAGADVTSQGEIHRAITVGIEPESIVFSGAGKTATEIAFALAHDIGQFNIESRCELRLLSQMASAQSKTATIALRINPDVDAQTHSKITTGTAANKFGVPWQDAEEILALAAGLPGIRVAGLAMHIGSQITSMAPFRAAFHRLAAIAEDARDQGCPIESLDVGGGLGTNYTGTGADVFAYAAVLREHFSSLPCRLLLEPGRFLVADAGVLLTRLLYEKRSGGRRFLIVDAGMNDLLRPALYDAHHDIVPVRRTDAAQTAAEPADIVGPVCETSDTLARDYPLPPLQCGDLLAILQAGAYGASMACMYNGRPMAPEVLVSGAHMAIVRRRSGHQDMLAGEHIPSWLGQLEAAPPDSHARLGNCRPPIPPHRHNTT